MAVTLNSYSIPATTSFTAYFFSTKEFTWRKTEREEGRKTTAKKESCYALMSSGPSD